MPVALIVVQFFVRLNLKHCASLIIGHFSVGIFPEHYQKEIPEYV